MRWPTLRRPAFVTGAVLAAAAALPAFASAATDSTIVYQCPGAGKTICAAAPSGGKARRLAHAGYLAGVTRDGRTYGYVSASGPGIYQAPVAGGAATQVSDQGQASPIGVMSPDGKYFLEQLTEPPIGFSPGAQFVLRYSVAAGPSSDYTTVDDSTAIGMTYGWLGDTPLTAHSGFGLKPPSYVCVGNQNRFCGEGKTSPQLRSATDNITFPDGSPDGRRIVAVLAPTGQSAGALALFNASTGALQRTIATPPAGTGYSVPRFSPDGSQIVFESDPVESGGASDGAASIETVGASGGKVRRIAAGTNPFWGGAAGATTAPKVSLEVPAQRLATVRRKRRLTATCTLAGAGRCTVKATIAAATARRLHLQAHRHAKRYSLGSAAKTLKHRGMVTLRLRLPGKVASALRHTRSLKVTLTATSAASGRAPARAVKTITLR